MKSAPARKPQRRSSISFSDNAGTETATPGKLIPLLLLTAPGSITLVITSFPLTSTTSTVTFPSSIRMRSPALQSPGKPLYVVPTRSLVPSTSSTVIVKMSPRAKSCGPALKRARRIFGPCRSTRMATGRPAVLAASRTESRRAWCSSYEP